MKFVLGILLIAIANQSSGPKVVERLGISGPLKFGEKEFHIAWTDKPYDKYYVQEYLPAGQKVRSFKEMLTLHLFDTDISVKDAVQQKAVELDLRKKSDPACNYLIHENTDTNEYIVDFILSEISVVEFNVYRYKQVDIREGQKGILVYAYSTRSYGNKMVSFLKALKEERLLYIKKMTSSEMPVIRLQPEN